VSIALVVTRGFSNGTLIGTVGDVVTRGYTIGVVVIPPVVIAPNIYARWDTEIEIMPNFTSETSIRVKYRIEQDIIPRFKGKIDG